MEFSWRQLFLVDFRFDAEFEERFHEKMRLKLGLLKKELSTDNGQDDVEYLVSQCVSLQALISSISRNAEWSQMMVTAREAWQFTPNVISHFEKEVEHFLLEDKRRKEKLRQLKMSSQSEKEARDRKLWTNWIKIYRERLDQESDEQNFDQVNQERVKVMNANNPSTCNFPDCHQTEASMFVQNLLNRLQTPYSDFDDFSGGPATSDFISQGTCQSLFHTTSNGNEVYLEKPPDDAVNMRLTCSS
ncbi:Protein adenylyltransferase SelO [Acropora cervicornis]|uniref:Protein adenylyltransferase SelO n=1 Tax=Acropora cervicornis TaxID=6130 RepID=A0AAD9V8I6_ACRCE|nr:Protein adenylyltransferase SelO [Acropora cervicornis]